MIMNLIKGFNRLFIVLAVISMLPGFFLGFLSYENIKKIDWDPPNAIIRYKDLFREFTQKEIIDYKMPVPPDFRAIPKNAYYYDGRHEIRNIKFVPPVINCIIAGIISSILSFFFILYFLKGIMFVILWITSGFKEDKII
jgi:hypothetical protein